MVGFHREFVPTVTTFRRRRAGMKTFIQIFLAACLSISAVAAPVVLDLSHSHTVADLKRSGLQVKEIAGGLHGQAYSFQNQEVTILLPGGRSITQNMVLGTIDTKEDSLTELYMYGDVMPHDQAVQVERMFHESFGLPLDRLNLWDARNRDKTRNGEPYSISANLNFYPRVGVGIKSGMNDLYPWIISSSLSWHWDEHRNWNEERSWRELPPPTIAAISLNPPSGVKYDLGDAYRGILAWQAVHEQRWLLGILVLVVVVALALRRRT